jgi:cobalt/nickel transport system permease protein
MLAVYTYKISKTEEKDKVMVNTSILAAVTVVASSISIPSPFGVPLQIFYPLVANLLGH